MSNSWLENFGSSQSGPLAHAVDSSRQFFASRRREEAGADLAKSLKLALRRDVRAVSDSPFTADHEEQHGGTEVTGTHGENQLVSSV